MRAARPGRLTARAGRRLQRAASAGGGVDSFGDLVESVGSIVGLTRGIVGSIRGAINLTVPLATWLGGSGEPGHAAGYGPLDAADSRDLADAMAAGFGGRWCITFTSSPGPGLPVEGVTAMADTEPLTPARAQPVVVTLPREIDMTNACQVSQRLCAALAAGAPIVVADMTATRFCDSMGLRALVLAHEQASASSAELRVAASAQRHASHGHHATGHGSAHLPQHRRSPDRRHRVTNRLFRGWSQPPRLRPSPLHVQAEIISQL